MLCRRSLLLMPLVAIGLLLPAQAQQGPQPLSFKAPVTNVSAEKVAFLLDPAHNDAPDDDFAWWPGLPSSKDLSPQASRLFEPAPQSSYRLPNGVLAVTPTEGQEDRSVTIWFPFTPNVNVGPGSPVGSVLSAIKWLDQPNEANSVFAKLWRFTDDIPEPFAKMLEGWDGKSPLIQEFDPEELRNVVLTGNYVKDTDTSKYKLKSGVPLNMEFHSNLVSKRKDPAPPKDRVRVTVARFLSDGRAGMDADSQLSVLFDSPGDFWDPILVPEFSPQSDLVVLLPEEPDRDEVKATFLQFHITVPAR